jgi:hypothetical protein
VATEEIAYARATSAGANAILHAVDGRFGEFCILKLILLRYFLRLGVEVTLCDSDIVWFRNPLDFARERAVGVDFATGMNHFIKSRGRLEMTSWSINIGLMTWNPTPAPSDCARSGCRS